MSDDAVNGMREAWEPGARAWFEYRCWEDPGSVDADLWARTHQEVTVLARAADENSPRPLGWRLMEGMPHVYRVRFADGSQGDAFEDELLTDPRWYQRPGPPEEATS